MVYPHARLYICCVGGDAVEIFAIVLKWIKKLFIKEKKPVSVTIQAPILNITIINIHKD